jgi:hypothetical protein
MERPEETAMSSHQPLFGVEDNGLGLVRPFSSHSLLFFHFLLSIGFNSILL